MTERTEEYLLELIKRDNLTKERCNSLWDSEYDWVRYYVAISYQTTPITLDKMKDDEDVNIRYAVVQNKNISITTILDMLKVEENEDVVKMLNIILKFKNISNKRRLLKIISVVMVGLIYFIGISLGYRFLEPQASIILLGLLTMIAIPILIVIAET